jgi:hypothetical protein
MFEHPFVGASGAELARMLSEQGLAPSLQIKYPSELDMIQHWKLVKRESDIDLANVFNTHPDDDNILHFFQSVKDGGVAELGPLKPGKYVRPELKPHVEALWSKIDQDKPTLVVAMGNTPCWAILGETKISTIRGTVKKSPRLGVKVLPTYHPAAVLHQYNLRTVVLQDLGKVKREAEFPEIRRITRYAILDPTLDEIREWMQRPAEFYSVDIETDPALPISMIGFARSHDDALVIPFYDPKKANGSYWSVSDEVEVMRLVDLLLKKPIPKVFQNGVFDLSHLLRIGFRPTMCNDDTMLLHHAIYPELLKGLGFLGSIYSDEIAWKPMGKKGNNLLKRDE